MDNLKIKGKVVKISPAGAEIEISPPSECSGCRGCDYSEKKTITFPSKPGLSPGSAVTVAVDCSALAGMSFIAYFIPALFLVAGFAGGYLLWGNPGGFFGGIILLGAGSFAASRLSRNRYRDAVRLRRHE